MALTSYKPEFPYKGNQIIISSGRAVIHSKDDTIFLFGKKAVSISTPGTLNVDASKGVILAAPIIELGLGASVRGTGEPLLKGFTLITQLNRMLDQMQQLSEALTGLQSEPTAFAASLPLVVNQAKLLSEVSTSVKGQLAAALSTTTFTT